MSGLSLLEQRWEGYRATLGDVDVARLADIRKAFFAGILMGAMSQVQQLESIVREVDEAIFGAGGAAAVTERIRNGSAVGAAGVGSQAEWQRDLQGRGARIPPVGAKVVPS